MKVLLTGALGNLGLRTIESLLDQGHEVRCLDLETKKNQKRARRFGNRIETAWGGVRRPLDLEAAVRGQEVVLHLAFIIDVLRSEREPEWAREIDVGGTRNLLLAMQRSSTARRILFASSIGVYGHSQHLPPPRRLSDPVHPNTVYGRHKMECEELVKSSGLDWCILRYAFSPPPDLGGFDPIIFHIELNSRMEFVHPQDVGLATAKAVASPEVWGKTLLIGGGPGCQITHREFIEKTMSAVGIGDLPDSAFAPPPSSPMDWVDSTESESVLQYQRHSFEDFVREVPSAFGPTRHFLRAFAPLVRRRMLAQSPYFRGPNVKG